MRVALEFKTPEILGLLRNPRMTVVVVTRHPWPFGAEDLRSLASVSNNRYHSPTNIII